MDEVVPDAPGIIDSDFLEKVCVPLSTYFQLSDPILQYKIDYVAHDVDPYGSAGHDDVYAFCKIQGLSFRSSRSSFILTTIPNNQASSSLHAAHPASRRRTCSSAS